VEQTNCTLRSPGGRWVLSATVLASGGFFLAGSAVPVALPSIQSSFSTSFSSIQWVIIANLLTLGALILVGGALGDYFGRKRIFMAGMVIVVVAALVSAFAVSIGMLLGLQVLQGAGAALMVPQSLAIINDCFAEKERGRAIGLWAGISGSLTVVGPLVGGWLIQYFSWRAVFFIVAPVILGAFLVTLFFVPANAPLKARKLDWPGGLAILIGLFGLVYGLMTGQSAGWGSPTIVLSLVAGILGVGLFIFIEIRQRQPLVYLKIFKDPLVAGANLVTLLVYFGLNGLFFFTILTLQQVHHYSPAQAGLAILPPGILITLLTWPTGALSDKIGPRFQMIVSPLLVSAGMLLLASGGLNAGYFPYFFSGLVLFGTGMAMIIPPLTKSALSVDNRFSGSASGLNNGVARLAGLLAIAVLGIVVVSLFQSRLNYELSQSILNAPEQQQILGQAGKLGGIVIPENFPEASRQAAQAAVSSAFIHGYRWAMIICAIAAFCGALVSLVTIKNNRIQVQGR
jgi:EmrB/QacA subfamily drug resistance transporter